MFGQKSLVFISILASFLFFTVAMGQTDKIGEYQKQQDNQQSLCMLIDGVEICDPELIEVILQYKLHLISSPPPGIKPIVVNTVDDLRELLDSITSGGEPIAEEKIEPPAVGPYDPHLDMIIWDPGGGCGGVGDNGGSDDANDVGATVDNPGTSSSAEQPIQKLGTFRICKCLAPERAPTRLCPTANLCLEVDAFYIPGREFTKVLTPRVYLLSQDYIILSWRLSDKWTEATLVDSKTLFASGGGVFETYFSLTKNLPVVCVYRTRVSLAQYWHVPDR